MGIRFIDINYNGLNKNQILEQAQYLKFIATANSQFIVEAQKNKKFKDILSANYTTFDGQAPFFLASKLNSNVHFEKISGSDLIYDFCEMAKEKGKKVFLLGGYEESNKSAVEKLKEQYAIDVYGYSPPYKPYPFDESHNKMILSEIEKIKPDVLFVGFGVMKQEFWIDENKDYLNAIGVRWAVGSGGTFEFVSGKTKRAPVWMQKAGLEWLHRVLQEPKRLWKRYLVTNTLFIYYGIDEIIRYLLKDKE